VVLNQLEGMRSRKEIGKALEAELDLTYDPLKANASTLALVKNQKALAELLGLSRVEIKPNGVSHESIAQFAEGHPQKAVGDKCERCWRYTEDVGKDSNYPTVCLRCAEALDAIGYPPYTASTPTE
jgi:isoleucyl-tRNA synthetase